MNERIAELGSQAWNYANDNSSEGDGRYGHLYRDKLAELIINECLFIIDDEREPEMVSRIQLWTQIKEHFGVN